MKKIKVLMLGWEYPPYVTGGLGTHCHYLTKALAKLPVKIYFVTPHPIHKKRGNLEIIGLDISQKFREDGKITSYGRFRDEKVRLYSKKVPDILDRYDFDIIHSQDWPPINAAVKIKGLTGKPLIQTIHSTELDKRKKPIKKFFRLEKKGVENADKVIAVSNHTKNMLIRYYGINGKKISVIYNATKQKRAPPEKKDGKVKYVLCLGRINYQKGLNYLVDAANILLKKQENIRFLIVGKGNEEHVEKLKNQVKSIGLTDKVFFIGFAKNKDYYYRKAHLFVMPSRSEPFGITPLEAIANGTPALISKQSGVSEILKNCVRFNYWDAKDLAKKILFLLNNEEAYRKLRKDGLEEVKDFTWDSIAKDTLKLYKEVLAKK